MPKSTLFKQALFVSQTIRLLFAYMCRPPNCRLSLFSSPPRSVHRNSKYPIPNCASQEICDPNFLRRWGIFAKYCTRVYCKVKKT